MFAAATTEIVSTVERAKSELEEMARVVQGEVVSAGRAFESLAAHTDSILNLAAAIVRCLETEGVSAVLPKVQMLGTAAKQFITERLQATTGILETVTTEVKLLGQLSGVAEVQEEIAFEIKALSVLTNIEVARLGTVGKSFQYLADELARFSKSVMEDTNALVSHTHNRKAAIEETRRVLSAKLPQLRKELTRIEVDLGNALAELDTTLTQLSNTPLRFRTCVQDIARQISGVVSAIQTHDINRQMNEHVQQAFALITSRMRGLEDSQEGFAQELPLAYAGILIQTYQLRTIRQTVGGWTSQIRTCCRDILRVSASEVVGIGPAVLAQDQKLSSQLGRIDQLEGETQIYSDRIQQSLSGLSSLVQLVDEHLQRSRSIRDRLRLLAFNSIVEANHLGVQADAILEISKSIKEISSAWSQVTNQSEHAMLKMLELVKQTNGVMEVFSPASNQRLRDAQMQTRTGLDNLQAVAEVAARRAQEMKAATERMQAGISQVVGNADQLDACFSRSDAVLAAIEQLRERLEADHPQVQTRYDAAEAERLFSASYTTELEREVLRAALRGAVAPVGQPALAGNSVELF